MITYIVVIGIAAAIGFKELPYLMRNRLKKEAAIVSAFLIAGSVMSVIAAKLISVPSPLDLLIWLYSPINRLLEMAFT